MTRSLRGMGSWWAVSATVLAGLIGFALAYMAFTTLVSVATQDTDQDRRQVQQRLRDYFAALLKEEDIASLRRHVHIGVDDLDLERVQRQMREDGAELVNIPTIAITRDRATATVSLRLRTGAVVEQQVLLQRGEDGWRIRDLGFHPSR